ncbi:MAG: hypothetical protein ABWZ99_16470 [Ilumatobacteraceae bacterium]
MTDTAQPSLLSADERSASARGFFDLEAGPSDVLPPPLPYPTASMALTAAPEGIPQLPRVNPSIVAPAPASPFAFSSLATPDPPTSGPNRKVPRKGDGRRALSWLLVLAVVGGGVYAGITYGPDLLDRAKGDTAASEPDAPLAFPPVNPGAVPPRTATFTVEQISDTGTTLSYEMTHDFDTGVSRLLVDRATSPDLEMLAVFDTTNVRQVDQETWWSMPRGEFPLVGAPERQRWLRTIDEYFPAAMRPFITIDQASEAIVGTEPTRHLVLTVDASSVARLSTDPITGQPVPPASVAEFVLPANMTATPEALEPITIEVWVDSNGLIRKLVEPGGISATVTVTALSPDPFNPTFPAPEVVSPLTAGQLVDLAL